MRVGADGAVDFTKSSTGSVDLVIDLTGYFTPANGYLAVSPGVRASTVGSLLNFGAGQLVADARMAGTGSTGAIYLENASRAGLT